VETAEVSLGRELARGGEWIFDLLELGGAKGILPPWGGRGRGGGAWDGGKKVGRKTLRIFRVTEQGERGKDWKKRSAAEGT